MCLLLSQCKPPVQPSSATSSPSTSEDPASLVEVWDLLDAGARELKELTQPKNYRVWGDQLNFRAWPGTDAPLLATLEKDEVITYLYHRTARQTRESYGTQQHTDSWMLVKVGEQVGWVHGGGVVAVPSTLGSLLNPNNTSSGLNMRKVAPMEDPTFEVVPGKRVGDITLNTSEKALLQTYGSGISRGTIEKFPGEKVDCTVLFEGEKNEINITWKDAERTRIQAVYITHPEGNWYISPGVYVGQPLKDLAKLNRAPIQFYGFSGNYAGVTDSFTGGKLSAILKHGYLSLGKPSPMPPSLKTQDVVLSTAQEVGSVDIKVKRMVIYLD